MFDLLHSLEFGIHVGRFLVIEKEEDTRFFGDHDGILMLSD